MDGIEAIVDPLSAKRAVKNMTTSDGILLLNNKHQPVGAIAITPEEMGQLKFNPKNPLDRIFKAIDTPMQTLPLLRQ